MGFKLKNPGQASKIIAAFKKRVEQAIINRFIYVGLEFVKNARNNGTYLDQTGNLRSSIGFIVLKNGKKLREDFEEAEVGSDKNTGLREGKKLAKEVSKGLNIGYVLICVAGMNYAAAVESKGKDVLTASSITAKNDLEKAIRNLKNKLKK